MLPSCFVTGTDTDVGKTIVTTAILRWWAKCGLHVAGMKPIASGFTLRAGGYENHDIECIKAAANVKLPPQLMNQYSYIPAIAPHIAAEQEGGSIDQQEIRRCFDEAQTLCDRIVVEGAGGWRVPLKMPNTDHTGSIITMGSLARQLRLPVVLVVGMRLGCINHALLSSEAILSDGVKLAGWVANWIDPDFESARENLVTLKRLLPAPLLFEVPFLDNEQTIRVFTPKKLVI